jgi:ribulose-phosphate 3-epimerase
MRCPPDDRPDEDRGRSALPDLQRVDAEVGLSAPDRSAFDGRRIAPSILSSDFARLGSQVAEVMDAGARVIHVDVMDGRFVPPITIGPLIVSAIAEQVHEAGGVLDCHLMIDEPGRQIGEFAAAGADSITFHAEAAAHSHRLLAAVREAGCLAGLALNPGTAPVAAAEVAGLADILLCMSVNPGWGGQSFIQSSPGRIERLRSLSEGPRIEVDGGIDPRTAPLAADAGADLLVAGSAIFSQPDPAEAYAEIAAAAGAA